MGTCLELALVTDGSDRTQKPFPERPQGHEGEHSGIAAAEPSNSGTDVLTRRQLLTGTPSEVNPWSWCGHLPSVGMLHGPARGWPDGGPGAQLADV